MEHLRDLAYRYGVAETTAANARQHLIADKETRRSSLTARFVDWATNTAAEKTYQAAQENLSAVRAEALQVVETMIRSTALTSLNEDTDTASRRSHQNERAEFAQAALHSVQEVISLAQQAHEKLTEAAESCSSASTMEIMDAVSSNKGIALMSTAATAGAKSKIDNANQALTALVSKLRDREVPRLQTGLHSDMTDLVFDMALDLPLDIFSFMNIGKLSKAGDQCKEAAKKVTVLISDLSKIRDERLTTSAEEREKLLEIDRPYLQEAAKRVPDNLSFAVPDYVYGAMPSHTMTIA